MPELLSDTATELAAASAELTLRLCGTPQNGRLVRLRGAKCTVGSDSQCTLRLRAAGVQQLHCLILRGAEGTVVRSLAGVTRLNGTEITESVLEPGDRLTIGAVEFEVVGGLSGELGSASQIGENLAATEGLESNPRRPSGDASGASRRETALHGHSRARRLLSRLREIRREYELAGLRLARLEESEAKLTQSLAELESERQKLAEAQSRANADADSQRDLGSQLEEQSKAIEQDRAALDQARLALEQERAGLLEERRLLDEERQNLEQQRSATEQEREQVEQVRGTTEAERSAIAQEREALARELAAVESKKQLLEQELREFEEHKQALTLERLDWQTEASRAEAELVARRDEVERRAATVEKQIADQEAARRRIEEAEIAFSKREEALQQIENELLERKQNAQQAESELLEQKQRAQQTESELLEQKQKVQQASNELLAEKQKLQDQAAALENHRQAIQQDRLRLDAERQALVGEQSALADQRRVVEELQQQDRNSEEDWSQRLTEQASQLNEATERLNAATQELAHRQALVEAIRQEQDEERQQWNAERSRLLSNYQQLVASDSAWTGQGIAPPQETIDEADLPMESADDDSLRAAEESAVARGGDDPAAGEQALALTDDEQIEITIDENDQAGEPQSLSPSNAVAEEADPVSATPAIGESEEESIDDYMTRLLKRVQSIGQRQRPVAVQLTAAKTEAPPLALGTGVATHSDLPADNGDAPQVLTKLSRRAAAPELSSDIAAMRELANLSARAALDKHAHRNWGRAAFGKLTIAVLAATAGVGAVHFASSPDSMLMYAGLLSFVITLFWLLQTGILMKNVYQAYRRQQQMARAVYGDVAEPAPSCPEVPCDAEDLPPAEIITVQDRDECVA